MTTTCKDGIPSDSSFSVPQELLDYILDFLHDDSPTLRACALVSRAFLPCSRYHVYSSVTIVYVSELDKFREKFAGQLYQCQNLAALLEHSPHVAPLVTRFGIHANWHMPDILMYTSLLPIIQSLRNLSHIEFVAPSYPGRRFWVRFPVDTRTLFLAALRSLSLKTLILKGFNFPNDGLFDDVITAAAANPTLKHLSLLCHHEGAETSEPYPPIRPPTNGLPALETLSISGRTTPRNILWLFFTQYLYSVSGIRHLSLQIYRGTPCSLIQSLLNEMKETLECFTLEIIPRIDRKVGFDLSRHRNLSSFYAIVPDSWGLGSVPEMRLNPTLRTLTVEHFSEAYESAMHELRAWKEIDRLALPALERVHIMLHDSVHGACYLEGRCNTCELQFRNLDTSDRCQWQRWVENNMPLLNDRGILEVEVIKQRHSVSEGFG
ncbi:hypothetical protein ARMGADRAFT_1019774 [Armillaria gallica]|uniref:F-box domain-containing protein n=1 Tax=Armillaria gallica TaxID=47427 RepID=A0A2H3CGM4_ARMGA|nr:hypothetical protein ARMGADRAFT_1019774 [Armillaria gallica]